MISSTRRPFTWGPLFLAFSVLAGCGGGGGGGDSDTPDPVEVSEGEGVPKPTPLPADVNLRVAPGKLDLIAFTDAGLYQYQDVSLHVQYRGHGVVVGFAPDVAQPSWLSIIMPREQVVGPEFDVPLTVNATGLGLGQYQTSLRFVSGYVSGWTNGLVDVPITLRVVAAPPVFSGDIQLSGLTGQLSGTRVTLPLDFNGAVPQDVTVSLRSDMGDATQWLAVDNNWRSRQLTVSARPDLPVGVYAGVVNVTYTIQGAKGLKAIPFRLDVAAAAPVVQQVSPSYLHAGRPGVLVLRGHAFTKAATVAVSVGGSVASSVRVVNDTEIRAVFNTPPGEGAHTVQVAMDGRAAAVGAVQVLPVPSHVQQDIAPPCRLDSGTVLYDPRRNHLIGFCDDTYYVMGQRNGAWQVISQRSLEGMGHAGWFRSHALLTTDQKYLVVSGPSSLILLDPATLETLDTRPIPKIWHESAGYGYLWLDAALNSGQIVFRISGMDALYYVYDLNNRTMARTEQATRYAHVVNANASAAGLSTVQLVYVKNVNLSSMVSSDPGLFTVTFFPAPDQWMADYAFPAVSPDGQKALIHGWSGDNVRFTLYDTATVQPLGQIVNSQGYAAAVARYAESGGALYIVDGGQGRLDVYGAQAQSTGLRHTVSFTPYAYYAGLSAFLVTPDEGAAILYGATNGDGVGAVPPIRIVPIPR